MRAEGRSSRPALFVGLLLALVMLPSSWSPAGAHASCDGTDPAEKATISQPPSSVSADCTEPLVEGSRIRVVDPCGNEVDDGNTQVVGKRMSVGVSSERAGTYSVYWDAVSVDGHTTAGDYVFNVSNGSSCEGGGGGSGGSGASDGGGGSASGGTTSSSDGSARKATGTAGGQDASGREGSDHSHVHGAQGGNRQGKSKKVTGGRRHKKAARSSGSTVLLREAGAKADPGLSTGWLLIGLTLAGLIGGVGGFVHAGLAGSRSGRQRGRPKKRA